MVAHDHAQPEPRGAAFWRLDDAARLPESVTAATTVGYVNAGDRSAIFPNKRQDEVGSRTASPRSVHPQGEQPVIEVPVHTPERSYFSGDSDAMRGLKLVGVATCRPALAQATGSESN